MPFNYDEFLKKAEEEKHSKEYLDATLAYAKKLDDKCLPVIFSTIHFAASMNITSDVLVNLINSYNYTYFNLKKKSGNGFREIMVPNEKLKYVQRWINYNILQQVPLSDFCTGFRPGFSILKNAIVHENSKAIYKIDLLRFFDTITDKRVFGLFKSLGYVENLAYDLGKICTSKHKRSYWSFVASEGVHELKQFADNNPSVLPQGAPTSPTIANILATRLDKRFAGLSQVLGFRYTRYADDLTFSITEHGRFPDLSIIEKIITDEGFFINRSKIKYFKQGMKQYVTGLTVTHGVNVSKKDRKEIFQHLYYCKKFGPTDHLKNISKATNGASQHFGFQDWLLGKISFIYSVDKANGIKMLKEFEKIDWPIDEQNVTDNLTTIFA